MSRKCPKCGSNSIWQERRINGYVGCDDCGYKTKDWKEFEDKTTLEQIALFEEWKILSDHCRDLGAVIQNRLDNTSAEEVDKMIAMFDDSEELFEYDLQTLYGKTLEFLDDIRISKEKQ